MILEAAVLPVGGGRVRDLAGQRQRRQAPAGTTQNRHVGRGVVVQARRAADAAAQLRASARSGCYEISPATGRT